MQDTDPWSNLFRWHRDIAFLLGASFSMQSLQLLSHGGGGQFDMLHTLQGHHLLRRHSHILALSPQDNHLQAVVVVQMDMEAGLDDIARIMLDLSQILHLAPLGMGIDQGDDPYSLPLHVAHPFVVDDVVSDCIPYTLGARGVAALQYYLVEPGKKLFR